MKINQRIKLTDLAAMLNLSTSTVSRALNDHPKIPSSTKLKVKELAHKMSYRPNPFAKGLFSKQTKIIGILLPTFEHHFFNKILGIIEENLQQKGYKVLCTKSGKDAFEEQQAFWHLANSHVDGIIAVLNHDHECSEFINTINEEGIPILFLDRIHENIDANFVISDDFMGAYEAVDHLIKIGRKKILLLEGHNELSTSFYRKEGYKEALKKNNIPFSKERVLYCESLDVIQNNIANLHIEFDAVFCFDDYYAFEVLEYARKNNISIPKDCSIIGYANEPIAQYTTPKLSSVDQSKEELGNNAAALLLDEIQALREKKVINYITYKSSTQLVLRESC